MDRKSDGNALKAGLIDLMSFHDPRGSLTVVDETSGFPFIIRRAFWIYGVPGGRGRGAHAHRHHTQLLVPVSGRFTVFLDDGDQTVAYRLENPSQGLLVPPGVWNILEDFSDDAVCLALVSGPYDEAEYIRDYDDFRKFLKDSRP